MNRTSFRYYLITLMTAIPLLYTPAAHSRSAYTAQDHHLAPQLHIHTDLLSTFSLAPAAEILPAVYSTGTTQTPEQPPLFQRILTWLSRILIGMTFPAIPALVFAEHLLHPFISNTISQPAAEAPTAGLIVRWPEPPSPAQLTALREKLSTIRMPATARSGNNSPNREPVFDIHPSGQNEIGSTEYVVTFPDRPLSEAESRFLAEQLNGGHRGAGRFSPNYIYSMHLMPPDPELHTSGACAAGLIGQYWAHTAGLTGVWENAPYWWINGAGSTIAFLDTGVDATHRDLHGAEITLAYDAQEPLAHWHGTATAGVAAAQHNNQGIAGAAPRANIVSFYTLKTAAGTATSGEIVADLIRIINELDHRRLVVNLSLGGDGYDPTIAGILALMRQLDISVVVSAGNSDRPSLSFPAKVPSVIATGALDSRNNLAPYSNWLPTEQDETRLVYAPGGGLPGDFLTLNALTVASLNALDTICTAGTSFSAPVISSLVALLYQINPELTPQEIAYYIKNSVPAEATEVDFLNTLNMALRDMRNRRKPAYADVLNLPDKTHPIAEGTYELLISYHNQPQSIRLEMSPAGKGQWRSAGEYYPEPDTKNGRITVPLDTDDLPQGGEYDIKITVNNKYALPPYVSIQQMYVDKRIPPAHIIEKPIIDALIGNVNSVPAQFQQIGDTLYFYSNAPSREEPGIYKIEAAELFSSGTMEKASLVHSRNLRLGHIAFTVSPDERYLTISTPTEEGLRFCFYILDQTTGILTNYTGDLLLSGYDNLSRNLNAYWLDSTRLLINVVLNGGTYQLFIIDTTTGSISRVTPQHHLGYGSGISIITPAQIAVYEKNMAWLISSETGEITPWLSVAPGKFIKSIIQKNNRLIVSITNSEQETTTVYTGTMQRPENITMEDLTPIGTGYIPMIDPTGRWIYWLMSTTNGLSVAIYDSTTGRHFGLPKLPEGYLLELLPLASENYPLLLTLTQPLDTSAPRTATTISFNPEIQTPNVPPVYNGPQVIAASPGVTITDLAADVDDDDSLQRQVYTLIAVRTSEGKDIPQPPVYLSPDGVLYSYRSARAGVVNNASSWEITFTISDGVYTTTDTIRFVPEPAPSVLPPLSWLRETPPGRTMQSVETSL